VGTRLIVVLWLRRIRFTANGDRDSVEKSVARYASRLAITR
jgi:hypothetical protein